MAVENDLNIRGMKDSIVNVGGVISEHSRKLLDQEQGPKVASEPVTYDSTAYDFISKLRNQPVHLKTNKNTELAQIFLKKVGFYDGPIDGLYGKGTQEAAKNYGYKYVDKHVFRIIKGKVGNFLDFSK